MKTKGIVKIDEVGRLVIPKPIRKALNLKDRLVEVSVEGNKLIIKRYAPLGLCRELVQSLCEKMSQLSGHVCIAGDCESVTNVSGSALKMLEGKELSGKFKEKIKCENCSFATQLQYGGSFNVVNGYPFEFSSLCVISLGDENTCIGFFAFISVEKEVKMGEKEVFMLKVAKELYLSALKHEKNL